MYEVLSEDYDAAHVYVCQNVECGSWVVSPMFPAQVMTAKGLALRCPRCRKGLRRHLAEDNHVV